MSELEVLQQIEKHLYWLRWFVTIGFSLVMLGITKILRQMENKP